MRLPSIERRERAQAEYRDAMAYLARAAEGDDRRRKYLANDRVAAAVEALREVGINLTADSCT